MIFDDAAMKQITDNAHRDSVLTDLLALLQQLEQKVDNNHRLLQEQIERQGWKRRDV